LLSEKLEPAVYRFNPLLMRINDKLRAFVKRHFTMVEEYVKGKKAIGQH
jgi:hypothetical protein